MKQIELIMGMPITVEVLGRNAAKHIAETFEYFRQVDQRYSTYKPDSEISQINAGLPSEQWSDEMKEVLQLCEDTKRLSHGYFDIKRSDGTYDPSGLVKGWAIARATERLLHRGVTDFYIDAGGDIQAHGKNSNGHPWRVGIRNPFNTHEIVKALQIGDQGVATSGTYVRGQHIYDPNLPDHPITDVVSLTVVGPDIYEADRFATAAFAMGLQGIEFIATVPGLEAYMIDKDGIATFTPGFERYERAHA